MQNPAPGSISRGLTRLPDILASLRSELACDHFYFLRHGQTECNARRIFQTIDEPLNPTGVEQAERAAEVLARHTIRSIICSDADRAHHTARIVAARHQMQPVGLHMLRERHFGDLIGSPSHTIDWDCAPANGETLDDFALRCHGGLVEALAQPAPVLVVAHGGTLYVLASWLGVPVEPPLLANAHPLRFERTAQGWQAHALAEAEAPAGFNLA